MTTGDRYFLGGHDLEMEEIRALLVEAGLAGRLVDKALAWGAQASAYEAEIRAALARGETPVLVELADDLPSDIDRARLVDIDHHGDRAGADRPTALEQVFARLGLPATAWTRWRALVAANDVGHMPALRRHGATADEIRAIRDADRRAQGITAAIETESRRALAAAERAGDLLIVRTAAPTSSAIVDFVLPEYGGPGADGVVVFMVSIRSGPRGRRFALVVGDKLAQGVQAVIGEGNRLLVAGAVDPEAAVLRVEVVGQVPEQLLVLAEEFGGSGDGEHMGWRRHGQAARSMRARRQFHGSSAARSTAL